MTLTTETCCTIVPQRIGSKWSLSFNAPSYTSSRAVVINRLCGGVELVCSIEEVFEWVLEVDEDALGEDRGRIQIIVEYEMNLPTSSSSSSSSSRQQQQHSGSGGSRRRGRRHRQRSTSSGKASSNGGGGSSAVYRSVENRITAHVDIQRDNTYAIVPVVKVRPSLLYFSPSSLSLSPCLRFGHLCLQCCPTHWARLNVAHCVLNAKKFIG